MFIVVVVVNCLHFIILSLYVGQETHILWIFCMFNKWKIDNKDDVDCDDPL